MKSDERGSGGVKITLVYDNEVASAKGETSPKGGKEGLKADWGFACLVEVADTPRILFDTGTSGKVLLGNMRKLDIDPATISDVFISHAHWDHTGGLSDFLKVNKEVKVYVPSSFSRVSGAKAIIPVKESVQIHENIFSTGELRGIEQSLVVKTAKGLVVIAGCSHPGVGHILEAASQFGRTYALIGGLHGFREFDLLKGLDLVCACHCTQYKSQIKSLYPAKWVEGGAGKVILL